MERKALEAAKDYARRAREKHASLSDTKLGYKFVQIWEEFLRDLTASFNKLAHGARSGKSAAWAGRVKHDRWNDPLLVYLRNARDATDHGIDAAAVIRAEYRPLEPGEFNPFFGVQVKHEDGTEAFYPAENVTEVMNERAELVPVLNNGKTFDPPEEHFGQKLPDKLATTAGSLALAYLEGKIEEAEKLVGS